jgi:hypothetical protein
MNIGIKDAQFGKQSLMKKILFLVLSLAISGLTYAQGGYKPYNQFSVEAGLGYSMPMSGISNSGEGNLSSFSHIELGGRYMFNQNFGAKLNLTYDSFRESGNGTDHTRVLMSAYYNVGNLFDLTFKTYESVALFFHAGFGVGSVKTTFPDAKGGTDMQGIYAVGLSPRFRVTEKLAIMTDISYYGIANQHRRFSGERVEPFDKAGQNASNITISFGLVFNLGNKRYHADWY